jgi:uncharacterized membrane protein
MKGGRMLPVITTISNYLNKVAEAVALLYISLLTVLTMVGVVFRYVLQNHCSETESRSYGSIAWAEPLNRKNILPVSIILLAYTLYAHFPPCKYYRHRSFKKMLVQKVLNEV